MPIISVRTNMADKDLPAEFDGQMCQAVAEVLGKPVERVTLEVHTGVRMLKAGSQGPVMIVDIASFEVFDAERNKAYAPKVMGFLQKSTGLGLDRLVVTFVPLEKHNCPAFLLN